MVAAASAAGGAVAHAGVLGMSKSGAIGAGMVSGGAAAVILERMHKDDAKPRSQDEAQDLIDRERSRAGSDMTYGVALLGVGAYIRKPLGAGLAALGANFIAGGAVRLVRAAGDRGSDRTDLPATHSPVTPKTDAERAEEARARATADGASDD